MTHKKLDIFRSIATVIISGLCWYLSEGLSGSFWILLWIAPVPVLLMAYRSSARYAFAISFFAYLLGRLSWVPYLASVVPPALVIVFTLSLPLIFASVVSLTRKLVLSFNSWWVVFAFPVGWTGFEFLFFLISRDGTAGSIAYSQVNALPLIQIASITGIAGITFIVTLVPSAIALAPYLNRRLASLWIFAVTGFTFIGALAFGLIRLSGDEPALKVRVALISMNEPLHEVIGHPNIEREAKLMNLYLAAVSEAAHNSQVTLAVLPEKAFVVNETELPLFTKRLEDTAVSSHTAIVTGLTVLNGDIKKNIALVISATGTRLAVYTKVNLYEGEEQNGFLPGSISEGYQLDGHACGVAICKDLDFDAFMRQYRNVHLMTVPAWDFVRDGWLHSRMAIMRSVEEGFSMVRTARQGRLTITDRYARILSEASTADGNASVLTGEVPIDDAPLTFYGRFGGWFGALNLVGLIFFMFLIIRKRSVEEAPDKTQI